jgi:hypothetical protein
VGTEQDPDPDHPLRPRAAVERPALSLAARGMRSSSRQLIDALAATAQSTTLSARPSILWLKLAGAVVSRWAQADAPDLQMRRAAKAITGGGQVDVRVV